MVQLNVAPSALEYVGVMVMLFPTFTVTAWFSKDMEGPGLGVGFTGFPPQAKRSIAKANVAIILIANFMSAKIRNRD